MQQSNLFSSNAGRGAAMTRDDGSSGPAVPAKRRVSRRLTTGLLAAEFLLAIMVRIFIGVILFVLPWSPLWDNNHLLQTWPHLASLISYGATRGIVSGLGLINLWIAVDDTLHRGERHA